MLFTALSMPYKCMKPILYIFRLPHWKTKVFFL